MNPITLAEEAMGLKSNVQVDLTEREMPHGHIHVAIAWAGGVLWLDMSDQADHYCIDVRQFRGEQVAATGMFAIQAGRRVVMDDSEVPEGERVKAHGWTGAFMPILLTDKEDPTLQEEPKL